LSIGEDRAFIERSARVQISIEIILCLNVNNIAFFIRSGILGDKQNESHVKQRGKAR